MSWFYISNNEQKGPATDEELAELVQQGIVSAETQVWREGMAEWKPYGELASPEEAPHPAGLTLGLAGGSCSECGQSFRHEDLIKIEGHSICAGCKPAMVGRIKERAIDITSAEETRREYLKHEAAVRSVGTYFIVIGSFLSLGTIAAPFSSNTGPINFLMILIYAVLLALFAGLIWIGALLRKLDRRAKVPTLIVAGLGVASSLPTLIGWIIPAYILYLVLCQKGKMVFSDHYSQVIRRTPHIKYKMWIILKILLIVFGVLIVLGILAVLFAPKEAP